jgi:hypothetical protein
MCALLALWGCSEAPAEPLRTGLPMPDPFHGYFDEDPQKPPDRGTRRAEKKKKKPVPVYADGAFLGMIRYNELPARMPTVFAELASKKLSIRFAWTDYFAALGIDVDAIEVVHFYGSGVCIISGDELRRLGRKLRFSFSRARRGHVRMEFPNEPVEKNAWIDRVVQVGVYLTKKPPHHDDKGLLRMPDGAEVGDEMPYSDGERHGGTRVYVDNVFKGSFRRRALTPKMLVDPKDPESAYSLEKALASLGVSLEGAKHVRFANQGDMLVREITADELASGPKLNFALPRHSRGRVVLGDEKLESITVYTNVAPADRPFPHPAGSSADQPEGDNPAYFVVPFMEQTVH